MTAFAHSPRWGEPYRRPGTDDGLGSDHDGNGVPETLQRHNVDPHAHADIRALVKSGGATAHYLHRQESPQSVVTIAHGLSFRPGGVSLFSLDLSTKYRAFGVQHLDANTLRISMDQPTACVVILS